MINKPGEIYSHSIIKSNQCLTIIHRVCKCRLSVRVAVKGGDLVTEAGQRIEWCGSSSAYDSMLVKATESSFR
jgi:hypothetical protein